MKNDRVRPSTNKSLPVDEYLRNLKERKEREYRRPHNNDVRRWQDHWGSEDYDEENDR